MLALDHLEGKNGIALDECESLDQTIIMINFQILFYCIFGEIGLAFSSVIILFVLWIG